MNRRWRHKYQIFMIQEMKKKQKVRKDERKWIKN